jgi:7-carboxy-7-deazaguanine synthase
MNLQLAEKPNRNGNEVEVHSIFPTIQGEGPLVGHPAVFVRLTGCNLQCPQCDTEYTSHRIVYTPDQLLDAVTYMDWPGGVKVWNGFRRPLIVFTGGEPFRQAGLGPAVRKFLEAGHMVQIETNGTMYQDDFPYASGDVLIVCSPKAGINTNLARWIGFYKYVVSVADGYSEDDGLPNYVLGQTVRVARPENLGEAPVWLQPADEQCPVKNAANLELAKNLCMKHGYVLCVQVHKMIGVA